MSAFLRRFFRRVLVPGLVIGAPLLPALATAQTVFKFDGAANQVGKALPAPGSHGGAQVNISGKLVYGGTLDLCSATVSIESLLGETAGDLLTGPDGNQILPVLLADPRCDDPNEAVFESPGEQRPRF